MHTSTSRRVFLRKTALVATGITLLPSTSFLQAMSAVPCPFEGYAPVASWNNDLRKYGSGVPLVKISGTIYDAMALLPKGDTLIEMWHLSPGSDKFAHCGKTMTDSSGRYSFITDFPNNEEGKAARIYFKIGSSSASYFTELILNDFGAHITGVHWERNNVLQSKMYPQLAIEDNQYNITFNMTHY